MDPLSKFRLDDKVAIVTGGGKGIGKAIALCYAQMGADVVVAARNLAPLEETAAEIEALGRKALPLVTDVTKSDQIAKLVETTMKEFGHIDILVNNAGGVMPLTPMVNISDEEWDWSIKIDLTSTFLCSRAVLKPMLKQRRGRIISISSVVGVVGNPGQANYASAKAGIIGLTRSIAKEVGSRGITVNAVAPGFIDTEMTAQLQADWREQLKKQIPLGYLGAPEDVAEAVAFLASDAARYITGQVLGVDGGMAVSWL